MANSNRWRSHFAVLLGVGIAMLGPSGAQCGDLGDASAVRAEMLVSTSWLTDHLDDPKVVVLHIGKERKDYDTAHIPGARFVAWEELTATRAGVPNELPPAIVLKNLFERLGVGDVARLVLYGDMSGLFAARAYFTLDYLGHGKRAALLDGGFEIWMAENRPISNESPRANPSQFTPQVRPEVVVGLDVMRDLSWVASNVDKPRHILLDARPPDEYSGEMAGEGVPRGGHIPGSANIYWMQNLTSKKSPMLRPASELRARYEAAGAGPDVKIITYCRTGGQASHAYFTAKYLGYTVAMYDGSFIEWSKAPGTSIIKSASAK